MSKFLDPGDRMSPPVVSPPGERMPSYEEVVDLLERGVLGRIEARNMLAELFPLFAKHRDNDVDEMIREIAARNDAEMRKRWEQEDNYEAAAQRAGDLTEDERAET